MNASTADSTAAGPAGTRHVTVLDAAVDVLPAYFAEYEEMVDLPVHRPVRVSRVERIGDPGAATGFTVTTDAQTSAVAGTWRAEDFAGQRVVIDDPAPERLADAVRRVDERTREGVAPMSVIGATGRVTAPWVRDAERRGALVRHPMFTAIEPDGLRTPDGGIRVADGRALDEPRHFLTGYGPSQSAVGAHRAGRDAVRAILRDLRC